jgi:HEAT repeat protein
MTPEERDQRSQELGSQLQQETSPSKKLELVRALAKFETPMAETGLRMALADPDPIIRRAAVEAWGTRQSEQAVQVLGQTLSSDTDLDVRMATARQLGNFNSRAAIESLGVALDDPNPALQFRAIASLRMATGKDYGGDVAAWRQVVQGGEPTNFEQPSIVQRWLNLR